jgi:hypothetical protein
MDMTGADGVPLVTNIWGELVFRKVADRPFAVPVDHVGGPDAGSNAAMARRESPAHDGRSAVSAPALLALRRMLQACCD